MKKIKNYQIFIFFLIFFLLVIFSIFKRSIFLQKRERINLVFYGEKTAFFSLGLVDNDNYFIPYNSEIKINVPGGFGYYRIGGIGKLVSLEKKPEIFKKAFSQANSVFIDFYFYPRKVLIYHQKQEEKFFLPSFSQIFFYSSNANIFERIYLYFLFSNKRVNDFQKITPFLTTENKEKILDEKKLSDYLLGNFYEKTYRNEKVNVQIIYSKNQKNAVLLSRIIEGQGIRIADLTYETSNKNQDCQIIENKKEKSQSALRLASFFNCSLLTKETALYDIIFRLGRLEEKWEVY